MQYIMTTGKINVQFIRNDSSEAMATVSRNSDYTGLRKRK